MNDFCANMAKESFKTTTPPNVPTKNSSSCTTAITALFLKTYFFKLASDVSGAELLRQLQELPLPRGCVLFWI
jgi:hypothetical protein